MGFWESIAMALWCDTGTEGLFLFFGFEIFFPCFLLPSSSLRFTFPKEIRTSLVIEKVVYQSPEVRSRSSVRFLTAIPVDRSLIQKSVMSHARILSCCLSTTLPHHVVPLSEQRTLDMPRREILTTL